jgi:hypothetical protein
LAEAGVANMKKGRFWKLRLAILTVAVLSAGALGTWEFNRGKLTLDVSNGAPLRNYGVVWEHELTRSGMPGNDSGWQWLRGEGVRSIVTFRPENDVDYDKFGFERVLRIPMRGDPPTDVQAEGFLRFIQNPSNQPVHIHCTAGKSRTGMMAALVRYSIDGWPMEKALEESRAYRGGEDLPATRVAWLRNWAARHQPGSYRTKR